MELIDAISCRHMVRSFTDDPIDADLVDRLCDLARRAPSAGNAQATEFLILDEVRSVAAYWDVTLPAPKRASFRWPGLVAAPALVLVTVRPDGYVERYAEPDKAGTGLGEGQAAWPVPYWWVDAGASVEHLLLGAVDAGLGACLFGAFEHEQGIKDRFAIPADRRLVATVALGRPDPDEANQVGRSARRPRRPLGDVIHRNSWR